MTTSADPVKMIRNGAPRLIESDDELEHHNRALIKLLDIEEPSREESAAIDLLTLLIEKYDDEHHRLSDADPLEVIRFMMSQHGLQQKDLVPQFGAKSIVSKVLSGKRKLTLEEMHKLSRRFGISSDALITKRDEPARKSVSKRNSRVA